MTAINRGASPDGRLNLEQQKKRAKELLKAAAAGEPEAQARFAQHHPRSTEPKLADAQHVIARENGFASWQKLKAHADALAAARAAMAHAPDTPSTLHIRCGSDIKQTLAEAGFTGHFHEFADPFCQGPVRDLARPAFIAERRAFLDAAYGPRPDGQNAYAILDQLSGFNEIVLWFEHDSYDQLILAFLLSEFAKAPNLPPVKLVCVNDVPATRRFIGFGQLGPDVLRWLWGSRRELDAETFRFGEKVWRALTAPDPRDLFAIASAGTPLVPQMAGALMRHLMELPSAANGLSLVEQLALDIIAERGEIALRALFSPYQDREPLPFLGDTMFLRIILEMANAADPPIRLRPGDPGARPGRWSDIATLTETGRELLANTRDYLTCGLSQRWVGGVEIHPGEPNWRFDHARKRIVRG